MARVNSYFKLFGHGLKRYATFHKDDLLSIRQAWNEITRFKEQFDEKRPKLVTGEEAPSARISVWEHPNIAGEWDYLAGKIGEVPTIMSRDAQKRAKTILIDYGPS